LYASLGSTKPKQRASVKERHEDVVELLLEAKADPELKTKVLTLNHLPYD